MTKTVVTKTGAMPHSDGDDGNDIGGSDKVEGAISKAAMLHCDGGGPRQEPRQEEEPEEIRQQ